jgi:hypothetical protein
MRLAGDWAPGYRQVGPLPWSTLLLANLEGPVLQRPADHQPLAKAGPHLANGALPHGCEPTVLMLANNHAMDYGSTGLGETRRRIAAAGMHCVGAGSDLAEAAQARVIDWNGMRIGIVARCEVQFGMASVTRPGVAPFDATIYRILGDLKKACDIVVASVHAAAETCPWPSPSRQRAWRALIEAGADVVHGHHAHVPQGWEDYEGGVIFYGLGNLCVDPTTWATRPNTLWSLTPALSWERGRVHVVPDTVSLDAGDGEISIALADPAAAARHRAYLETANAPLADPALLEGLWQEAAIRLYRAHYASWLRFDGPGSVRPLRRRVSAILRRVAALSRRRIADPASTPNRQQQLLRHVLFACDSHSDAIATALGVLSGALEDLRTPTTAALADTMMPGPQG